MESFILVNTFSFILKRRKKLVKTVQAFSLYLGARFYFVNKFLVIIFFLMISSVMYFYLFVYLFSFSFRFSVH